MSSIDQIKQRLDLADVIRQYIKVEKAGSNFKACCPFHNEKTPSFYISSSRNVWHCFGCGKGGSIFDFVMEIEKVDFKEALATLAKRAGIELKKENPAVASERTRLLKILEAAKNFYTKGLEQNDKAMDYLIKERGMTFASIKEFELGYAPDNWRNLYDSLHLKGYSDSDIEKTGLIIKKSQDINSKAYNLKPSYYDRFRNRIIFPISDASGRIIAFGGRIFEADILESQTFAQESGSPKNKIKPAKYINSPQTILYDKSRVLYNFNRAKIEIAKQDFCVLVEGYMDALMSYQAGVKNVVAVSGTSLTHEHLNLIGRLTKTVVTSFDSDEAGIMATNRSIDLLLEKGFEIKILNLKEEKDPADLVKKDKKLWEEAVTQKKADIIDFYLNFLKKKYTKDNFKFAVKAKEMIFPRLVFVASEIEKSMWIKKMAENFHIKEDAVWFEFKKFQKQNGGLKLNSSFYPEETEFIDENKNKQTRINRLEERIVGILAIISPRLPKEKLSNILKNDLNNFSIKQRIVLDVILKENSALTNEENIMLQTIALKTEMFYNFFTDNESEFETELTSLLSELKKEKIRDKLNILGIEIKGLSEAKSENDVLYKKIEEFNKLSKELKILT